MPPIASHRYELLDKIAKGGMAEVYRARRFEATDYDNLVAVKRILPERAEEAGFVEMLIDEAHITAQLKHPNIAQLYELACDNTGYFLVMELLLGPNFAALIDKLKSQGRHLPQACAVEVIIQLLKALDYAHNKCGADGRPLHLVHRDISPDNLLLNVQGDVKLIDFGVAKAKDRLSDKTKAGMIKGKFSYLAPERLRSSVSDPRSDLFAAALVLWEALAGRIRFDAEDDRDLLDQIEANKSPTFKEMGISIPAQLEAILDKALSTSPDDRYQTAAEFLDALERFQKRFNPGDNTGTLGRLVASAFKNELRWLDDSIEKFRTGRLMPLGVIGGGVIEERFQITKVNPGTSRSKSYKLKRPKMRHPSESPFEEVPYLDDTPAQRVETSIFKENGIKSLSDSDFEEDSSASVQIPEISPSNISEVSVSSRGSSFEDTARDPISPAPLSSSPVPRNEKLTKTAAFKPVPLSQLEETRTYVPSPQDLRPAPILDPIHHETTLDQGRQMTATGTVTRRHKTRVFNFGEGAAIKITFSPTRLLVLTGALIGGLAIFAFFVGFGVPAASELDLPQIPRPPAISQTAAPAPAVTSAGAQTAASQSPAPAPNTAALPSAETAKTEASAQEAAQAPAATPAETSKTDAPVQAPAAAPQEAAQASAAASPQKAPQQVQQKKKKKRRPVKKRRSGVKKRSLPQKNVRAAAADADDLDGDDDFFQSDEPTDTDLKVDDDGAGKKGASRAGKSGKSAKSGADDGFDIEL